MVGALGRAVLIASCSPILQRSMMRVFACPPAQGDAHAETMRRHRCESPALGRTNHRPMKRTAPMAVHVALLMQRLAESEAMRASLADEAMLLCCSFQQQMDELQKARSDLLAVSHAYALLDHHIVRQRTTLSSVSPSGCSSDRWCSLDVNAHAEPGDCDERRCSHGCASWHRKHETLDRRARAMTRASFLEGSAKHIFAQIRCNVPCMLWKCNSIEMVLYGR